MMVDLLDVLEKVSMKYQDGDEEDLPMVKEIGTKGKPEVEVSSQEQDNTGQDQNTKAYDAEGPRSADTNLEAVDNDSTSAEKTSSVPQPEVPLDQATGKRKKKRLKRKCIYQSQTSVTEEEQTGQMKFPNQNAVNTRYTVVTSAVTEDTEVAEDERMVPMMIYDDEEVDVSAAFKTLLTEFGGRAKMSELVERAKMFPRAFFENLWLKKHKDKFKVIENKGAIEYVSVYLREARLCIYFNGPKRCFRRECEYFHVCCGFVTDSCKPHTHKCARSHNFYDKHNSALVAQHGLADLKNKQIAKLFRCSFPEACKVYNQYEPHDVKICPYLHVCDQCPCSKRPFCQLEHTCHSSKHNLRLLKILNVVYLKEEIVAKMVLGRNRQMRVVESSSVHSEPTLTNVITAADASEDNEEENVKDGFRTLLTKFGGRAKMSDLLQHDTIFPAPFFNKTWLKRHKHKFRIFEMNESIQNVSVYNQGAKLCFNFNSPNGCTDKECQYFHVCSGFVTETCKPHIHKCPLSHNFLEKQNAVLAGKHGLDEFKNKEIATIVRCTAPQVCREYNQGHPHDEESCPYLHVCDQFPCTRGTSCNLEHKCLSTDHNRWIFECFGLCHFKEHILEKMILRRNKQSETEELIAQCAFKTLLKKYEGRARMNDILKLKSSFPYSVFEISWLLTHKNRFVVFKNKERIELITVYCQQARVCAFFNSPNGCTSGGCQYFHVCSAFITGQCQMDVDQCLRSHNFFDQNNIELVKRKQLQDFRNDEIAKLVRCSSPEVCQEYNQDQFHKEDTCPYLHVCDQFPCGKGPSCQLEHKCFPSAHNETILKCFHINKFKEDWLRIRILGSKGSTDVTPLQIPKNRDKAADVATSDESSRGAVRKICSRSVSSAPSIAGDQFLCHEHIWGTCKKQAFCPQYHGYGRVPYQWQIELDETWHDFTEAANDNAEKLFCELKSSADSISFNDELVADIDLISMTAQVYLKNGDTEPSSVTSVKVRRLSTMSYIEGKGDLTKFTFWCWYWRDDDHIWVMYDSPARQYTLEKKYLYGQTEYFFNNGKFPYKLTFRKNKKMSQQNLQTGRKRRVIRRPIYVSQQNVLDKQAVPVPGLLQQCPRVMCTVPDHWVPVDLVQPFELANLEVDSVAYLDVKSSFHFTLPESSYTISAIFRVQNPIMWDRHCSHRRSMMHTAQREGLDAGLEERMLFHGTDTEKVVHGICVNGFDPRLCGKNGTAFGKGAYFAKKAHYSNRFTGLQKERFMFRARVLIGQFTKGNPNLTRPPPRQGHLLYDSCVDDVTTPSLFVMFDIDKAYPEFLIKYEKKDVVAPKPLLPSSTNLATQVTRTTQSFKRLTAPASRPASKALATQTVNNTSAPKTVSNISTTQTVSNTAAHQTVSNTTAPQTVSNTSAPQTVSHTSAPQTASNTSAHQTVINRSPPNTACNRAKPHTTSNISAPHTVRMTLPKRTVSTKQTLSSVPAKPLPSAEVSVITRATGTMPTLRIVSDTPSLHSIRSPDTTRSSCSRILSNSKDGSCNLNSTPPTSLIHWNATHGCNTLSVKPPVQQTPSICSSNDVSSEEEDFEDAVDDIRNLTLHTKEEKNSCMLM